MAGELVARQLEVLVDKADARANKVVGKVDLALEHVRRQDVRLFAVAHNRVVHRARLLAARDLRARVKVARHAQLSAIVLHLDHVEMLRGQDDRVNLLLAARLARHVAVLLVVVAAAILAALSAAVPAVVLLRIAAHEHVKDGRLAGKRAQRLFEMLLALAAGLQDRVGIVRGGVASGPGALPASPQRRHYGGRETVMK